MQSREASKSGTTVETHVAVDENNFVRSQTASRRVTRTSHGDPAFLYAAIRALKESMRAAVIIADRPPDSSLDRALGPERGGLHAWKPGSYAGATPSGTGVADQCAALVGGVPRESGVLRSMLPIPHHTEMATSFWTNRTEPSAMATFTPPG